MYYYYVTYILYYRGLTIIVYKTISVLSITNKTENLIQQRITFRMKIIEIVEFIQVVKHMIDDFFYIIEATSLWRAIFITLKRLFS